MGQVEWVNGELTRQITVKLWAHNGSFFIELTFWPYEEMMWCKYFVTHLTKFYYYKGDAFDCTKNRKRQRRKRQSVTAKREKSQKPKFATAKW